MGYAHETVRISPFLHLYTTFLRVIPNFRLFLTARSCCNFSLQTQYNVKYTGYKNTENDHPAFTLFFNPFEQTTIMFGFQNNENYTLPQILQSSFSTSLNKQGECLMQTHTIRATTSQRRHAFLCAGRFAGAKFGYISE